uniref:DJ-1/PfpI family protein n=1 Tax=Candidatus Aschnera chinzeii TaxID=1485666 RepID=A0AAT9G4G8_9ENTR|nr:MAG: DJ-1/PfpI family protein [Candidatus Aschnera chinzeii]
MLPKVLICLTNGVEDIEAVTIIDLLNRAKITTISTNVTNTDTLIITCAYGTKIIVDVTLSKIITKEFDALILPGGLEASKTYRDNELVINKIKELRDAKKIVGALCASPAIVIAYHNLYPDANMTCYPQLNHKINNNKFIESPICYDEKAKLLTGQGPGTTIEFSLKLIELLSNKKIAQKIASQLILPINIINNT